MNPNHYSNPKKVRVALLSVRYDFGVSPTLKGIASYLYDSHLDTSVIVDYLFADIDVGTVPVFILGLRYLNFHELSSSILKFRPSRIFGRLSELLQKIDRRILTIRLRQVLKNYDWDWFFCAEFDSLIMLDSAGFDLKRCVYLSLESTENLIGYDLQHVQHLLSQVAFCVIQSAEREADFTQYIQIPLTWLYLPVSLRPRKCPQHILDSRDLTSIKIVYSGHPGLFSKEFLLAYSKVECDVVNSLYIKGHERFDQRYFNQLREIIIHNNLKSKVEIEGGYYLFDETHHQLLCHFNIGLALYPATYASSPNWRNLIFSSGKIATYLWADLAIITNIESSLTTRPPFIFIPEITPEALADAFQTYLDQPECFHKAARELAHTHYNLDAYMNNILARII